MLKKIIYIAGYGRSGSTLLARILGCHEDIFTVGELINFLNLIDNDNSICSCGREIQRCSFWSTIIQTTKKHYKNTSALADVQKRTESISNLFRHILGSASDKIIYEDAQRNIIRIIFQKLPDNVKYIVDSSKTTWSRFLRPIALSKISSQHVKVIHIVRDGRGCMWSMIKGTDTGLLRGSTLKRHSPFPVIRTAIHWSLANWAAHIFQASHPSENYCRIRYEDIVEQPERICTTLGSFLGVNLDRQVEIIRKGGDINTGHLMAGNRMRSIKRIRIKADIEWKTRLSLNHQLLFLLLNWPMMTYYGYNRKHPKKG